MTSIDRYKALNDFAVPKTTLQGRELRWIKVTPKTCAVSRGPKGRSPMTAKPPSIANVLRVLEQYYIRTFGTQGKGNVAKPEPLTKSSGGSFVLTDGGKPIVVI